MRRALLVSIGALVVLVVGTYLAGEQTEVVVLRTFDAQGAAHDTKMWAVDHDGAVWVRVANPRRDWYQRLRARPHVELVRGGVPRPMRAAPDESPAARSAVDAGAEASLTLAAEGDSLLLDSLAPVAVHVSGVDAALTPGDQAIVDVVATVILQRLLESALAAAAEGLPILAFELPASVGPYGLPAGSPLGVVNPTLELTPTHLYLEGSLGILQP